MSCLTGVFALQALRVRRDNQKRYETAAAEARSLGMVVRVLDLPQGDYEYIVAEAPTLERLDWPPAAGDAGPSTGTSLS
jgi:hypothetical protein